MELRIQVIPTGDGRVLELKDSSGFQTQYFVEWDEVLMKAALCNLVDHFLKSVSSLDNKNTGLEIIVQVKGTKCV